MNKQKYLLLLCAILTICGALVAFFLFPQLSGNYSTLDAFREANKEHYNNGTFVCSIDLDGYICDFVVIEDSAHVVAIRCKNTVSGGSYSQGAAIEAPFARMVENHVEHYEESGELLYMHFSKLPYSLHSSKKQILWCFMDETAVKLGEGVEVYPFEHNGQSYVLYVKLENVK